MSNPAKRILGVGFDGKIIFAPRQGHSLLMSPASDGKTKSGVVLNQRCFVVDPKANKVELDALARTQKTVIIDSIGVFAANSGATNEGDG